jgi:hypothetical protein
MATHAPVHVVLELAAEREPVSGLLRSPGQPERSFLGWTELFAALEATLQASAAGRGEVSSDPRSGAA